MSTPSTSAAPMRCTVRRRSPASPAASTYSSKSPSAPTRVRRARSSRRPRRRASSHSRPCALCTTPPSTRSKMRSPSSAPFAARPCALANTRRGTTRSLRGAAPTSSIAPWRRARSWTSASIRSSRSSSYSERRSACVPPRRFSTSRRASSPAAPSTGPESSWPPIRAWSPPSTTQRSPTTLPAAKSRASLERSPSRASPRPRPRGSTCALRARAAMRSATRAPRPPRAPLKRLT